MSENVDKIKQIVFICTQFYTVTCVFLSRKGSVKYLFILRYQYFTF